MGSTAPADRPAGPEPDFAKVGPFRHVVNATLGALAAMFCFVCLLYLSIVVVAPVFLPVMLALVTGRLAADAPLSFAVVGLASSLYFFCGMVLGRFLLRAMRRSRPPHCRRCR